MGFVYTTEITLNMQHLIDVLDVMWRFYRNIVINVCKHYILKNSLQLYWIIWQGIYVSYFLAILQH